MSVCEKNTAGPSSLSLAKPRDNSDKQQVSALSILNQQAGQAVTEYVLILIVVVAIILGGLYQVNSAFKVWAQNYFGDYLSCLLETGELPALGGSVSAAAGVCNEMYEPFSLDKGRPLLASSGGGGGSSGSSGSSSSKSSDSSPSSSSERGVRETTGGSSGSSQINPSARFGATNRMQQNNENPASKRSSGSTYTGSTEASIPTSLLNSGSNERIRITDTGVSLDYSTDAERERKEIKSEGGKKSEDSVQERGRKKAMPLRAPASKTVEENDEGMTFGSFLRYLIIAAIIIALILVIGGQLLQISKSSGSD